MIYKGIRYILQVLRQKGDDKMKKVWRDVLISILKSIFWGITFWILLAKGFLYCVIWMGLTAFLLFVVVPVILKGSGKDRKNAWKNI